MSTVQRYEVLGSDLDDPPDEVYWSERHPPANKCLSCNGSGGLAHRPCALCGGSGWFGIDPDAPTSAMQGTMARLAVYQVRLAFRRSFWNTQDRKGLLALDLPRIGVIPVE